MENKLATDKNQVKPKDPKVPIAEIEQENKANTKVVEEVEEIRDPYDIMVELAAAYGEEKN